MITKIFIVAFVISWVFICYELMNAPEYDEDENPIEK